MEAGAPGKRLLLFTADYYNQEFAIEDIDGRWIGFGC
jgi:hypothetical protein